MDGWGEVQGQTLAEVVRKSRDTLSRVLNGVFPDRKGIDPVGADLIVWFDIVLNRRLTEAPTQGVLAAPRPEASGLCRRT